jgi:hypothetical protein
LLAGKAQPFVRDSAKDPGIDGDQPHVRILLQQGHGRRQVVGAQQVVPIKQRDQGRPCLGNGTIASSRDALVAGRQKADARIGEVGGNGSGNVVRCAVVDHQALPLGEGLREQGIERLAQKVRHSIGGYDNRDSRLGVSGGGCGDL